LRRGSYASAALLRGDGSFGSGWLACRTVVLGHATGGGVYVTGGRVGALVALGLEEALGLGVNALVLERVTSSRRPATT
jgi:hypothetical protein